MTDMEKSASDAEEDAYGAVCPGRRLICEYYVNLIAVMEELVTDVKKDTSNNLDENTSDAEEGRP